MPRPAAPVLPFTALSLLLSACSSARPGDPEPGPGPDAAAPSSQALSAPAPAPEALDAAQLSLPAGFRADRLYSVPSESQGSWVSLCADDAGRLYTSDQYGGLWRVTPPPLDSDSPLGSEQVERVEVELGEAQGLLWAFDGLYVVVNHGETFDSGLYRLEDTDGDDALDAVEHLASFEGYGEHGPHAVLLDPDGEHLVVVAGNHTQLPAFVERSRVPRVWDEDAVLPRIDDPNGHAVGVIEPAGWICRTDLEGEEWELLASGFRNAYDIAFDPAGELFTFDSDMEWDTGLPWYRPTRILHVTSGAEFGWRSGSAKWPDFVPDSMGSAVDIGLTSPTGIVFGTRARFPERWRRALFAADWAYGKIYAVHLEPDGASFTGSFEPFVEGEPLPVTDLAVGADGALYFTTGGRRTQSGLYRVTWTGDGELAGRDLDPVPPTGAARERLRLEALHADPADSADSARSAPSAPSSDGDIERAWAALDSPDRALRFAARTALELRAPGAWRDRALAEERPRASLEALLALVRCDDTLDAGEWLAALERQPWDTLDRDRLLAALRVTGLGLLRVPDALEASAPLAQELLALLPSDDDVLDRELVRVLARMQSPQVAPVGLDLLESAPSQEAAIHYAYALSELRTGWDDARRARLMRWFDIDSPELSGGVSFRDYIAEIRARAVHSLGISMPVATVEEPRAGEAAPVPAAAPAAFVQAWTVADLEEGLDDAKHGRSFERGREVYARTRCLECHRIAGEGGSTGPDLSGAGGRFGTRDLLEALLAPSAVVSDQYRDVEVWTVEGGVIVGRVVGVDDRMLTLRTAQGERVDVHEDEIETRRPHPLSRMPEGLLDTCTREEILDLVAYVLAGGDPEHEAFR